MNKIQMKISEEDIAWYLEIAPKFGKAIISTTNYFKNNILEVSSHNIENYFEKEVYKYMCLPSISFPFQYQINHLGEQYGKSICISVNNCVAHGKYSYIQKGDVVSIDCGVSTEAPSGRIMYFDSAITIISGNVNKRKKINEFVKLPLYALKEITKLKDKINTIQISSIIERYTETYDVSVVNSLSGHGIGYELHAAPAILNTINPRAMVDLVPGTLICPEPMYVFNDKNKIANVYINDDGWSVMTNNISTHWETILYYDGNTLIDTTGILSYQDKE